MRPWRCVPQGWLSRQGGLAPSPRPLPAAARVSGAGGSAIRPRSLSAASLAAPPAANARPGPAAEIGQGPRPPPAAPGAAGGGGGGGGSAGLPSERPPGLGRVFGCGARGGGGGPERGGDAALLDHRSRAGHGANPTGCSYRRKGKAQAWWRGASCMNRKGGIPLHAPVCRHSWQGC